MKLKKTFSRFTAVFLLLTVTLMLVLPAKAIQFGSDSFFVAGVTNIYLKEGQSTMFGNTNLAYAKMGNGTYTNGTYISNGAWGTNTITLTNAPISDVALFVNPDGSIPLVTLSGSIFPLSDGCTNTLTLTFGALPTGPNTPVIANGWSGGNVNPGILTISVQPSNNVELTFSTNVPLAFLQGNGGLRFLGCVPTGTATKTNYSLRRIRLNGFRP